MINNRNITILTTSNGVFKFNVGNVFFFQYLHTRCAIVPGVHWARAGDKQWGHHPKDTHPCFDSSFGWYCESANGFIAGWPCNMYKLIAGSHSPATNNRYNYGSNLKQSLTASSCATIFQTGSYGTPPTFSTCAPGCLCMSKEQRNIAWPGPKIKA